MSRVGTNERPVGMRRRRWAPEALELVTVREQGTCRVCGGMVERGDAAWRWRWRSAEIGHGACGWWTERDAEAVEALRALATRPDFVRCHDLGLLVGSDGPNGVREHRLSLVGRALWQLLCLGCACGASLDWSALPLIGMQDDGAGGRLELKNCPSCGSTRARRAA